MRKQVGFVLMAWLVAHQTTIALASICVGLFANSEQAILGAIHIKQEIQKDSKEEKDGKS